MLNFSLILPGQRNSMAARNLSLSVYLPPALMQQIQAYQTQHGIDDPAHAVLDILMHHFLNTAHGNPDLEMAALPRIEALEYQVIALTQQIALLNQPLTPPTYLPRSPLAAAPPSYSPSLPPRHPAKIDYEDAEDEPDEILWDFMPREGDA